MRGTVRFAPQGDEDAIAPVRTRTATKHILPNRPGSGGEDAPLVNPLRETESYGSVSALRNYPTPTAALPFRDMQGSLLLYALFSKKCNINKRMDKYLEEFENLFARLKKLGVEYEIPEVQKVPILFVSIENVDSPIIIHGRAATNPSDL